MAALISADNVCRSFPGARALGEVKFELRSGGSINFKGPREPQAAGIAIIHQESQLMKHQIVAQSISTRSVQSSQTD
jgi:ribose transport system ATP-binding protein